MKIISTGKYLPKEILSNYDLEKMVDTSNEWIAQRTGIKERRIAKKESCLDLAYKASKRAIKKANYDSRNIDLIIVATITAETASPSIASMLQAKLKLNNKDTICFDINAACTGFIYALHVANQMLASGQYKGALVVGAEKLSNVIDYTDRNTCILFGDGAGAMIIEKDAQPAYFYLSSKGDEEKLSVENNKLRMNGKAVFSFAVRAIQETINKLLYETNLKIDDIEKIIPHQANMRITKTAAENMGIDHDLFYMNIANYGNTSAASVIIALDEYLEETKPLDGKNIMLLAFGAGLTWGGALLKL